MGAIKSNDYTIEELNFSKLGRAFAHPARRRIINTLLENDFYRNVDFSNDLSLSEPAVKQHLDKLAEAGIITTEYFPHYYQIRLNISGFDPMFTFVKSLDSLQEKPNIDTDTTAI